ncbi:MAG: glucosidase, partial [Saprospiraceae bacterium]
MTLKDGRVNIGHPRLGEYFLLADGPADWLFCENETNYQRLYNAPNSSASCKDGINDFIVQGNRTALNATGSGTKAAALFQRIIPAGGEMVIRLRLTRIARQNGFTDFDRVFARRQAETDACYADLQSTITSSEARQVQRQAYAGMLWNKQFYAYDVARWLDGDPGEPPPPVERLIGRNSTWRGFESNCVISMPDKWEYPWFAAWDLAFHCLPLARLDPAFAKNQLEILFSPQFQRSNGQVPAYEWNFDDLNPPVKAWATWQVFARERQQNGGAGDRDFLRRMFQPLTDTYLWWINQKDSDGNDLFGGGFLGLDNVGVFDRSKPLDSGDMLDQADATAWMAFCALYMFRIAFELNEQVYAAEFFEHFLQIAAALGQTGTDRDLWDDDDEFFYDHLRFPDGSSQTLEVRSMVGLIPMFAVLTLTDADLAKAPEIKTRIEAILAEKPHLAAMISRWQDVQGDSRLLSLLRGHRTKALLHLMLDPREFWSDHGVRSLSRRYLDQPYTMRHQDSDLTINYVPGDSDSGMFGGNSNWRGPVWMPVNFLLVESIREFYRYYGPDFLIEYPIGSGQQVTLAQIADELARRLTAIFLPNDQGERIVHGRNAPYAQDPHFRHLVLFYEYFHGDTGEGLGASHQTGWTGLVALLLETGH